MATTKELMLGALIGTFIGSLAVAKRKEIQELIEQHSGTMAEKTKALAEYLIAEHKFPWTEAHHGKNHYFTGGALGLLAGASAMMLLAPKTGKMMRDQLSKAFSEALTHTKQAIRSGTKVKNRVLSGVSRAGSKVKRGVSSQASRSKSKVKAHSRSLAKATKKIVKRKSSHAGTGQRSS